MESNTELANYWVLILGTSGMILLASGIILFVYLYQRKLIKRKLAYQKIEDLLHKQELKSAYGILQAQDKERKRIAQDLHDNVSSLLATLNMYADTLQHKTAPQEKDKLAAKMSALVGKATEETRNLSHSLASESLRHFGLETALNDLVEAINEASQLELVLETKTQHIDNGEFSLNIYRIVQELLNNTLKHAQASQVYIELTQTQLTKLSLIYQDNGKGFDTQATGTTKGMGMKNLQARTEKLNGSFSIESSPGKGSTFVFEFELINNHETDPNSFS